MLREDVSFGNFLGLGQISDINLYIYIGPNFKFGIYHQNPGANLLNFVNVPEIQNIDASQYSCRGLNPLSKQKNFLSSCASGLD